MEKKGILKYIIISLVLIAIIAVGGFYLTRTESDSKQKFEVNDFTLESETTNYTYIDNTTSYSGKGIITTNNKDKVYLVVLKTTLKSGGNIDKNETNDEIKLITVVNGIGKFYTYDSGKKDEVKRPEYKFEVLGYQELE